MSDMKERMQRGELYLADDPELIADMARAQAILERFNVTAHGATAEQDRLLRTLLGSVGRRCRHQADVSLRLRHTDLDRRRDVHQLRLHHAHVAPITIGATCQIATRVQLLTATHPIEPGPRRAGWESGLPIVLGDNVWLGGGVIVCPGVTIGGDTVVGAGSRRHERPARRRRRRRQPSKVLREIASSGKESVESGSSTRKTLASWFPVVRLNLKRLETVRRCTNGVSGAADDRSGLGTGRGSVGLQRARELAGDIAATEVQRDGRLLSLGRRHEDDHVLDALEVVEGVQRELERLAAQQQRALHARLALGDAQFSPRPHMRNRTPLPSSSVMSPPSATDFRTAICIGSFCSSIGPPVTATICSPVGSRY